MRPSTKAALFIAGGAIGVILAARLADAVEHLFDGEE